MTRWHGAGICSLPNHIFMRVLHTPAYPQPKRHWAQTCSNGSSNSRRVDPQDMQPTQLYLHTSPSYSCLPTTKEARLLWAQTHSNGSSNSRTLDCTFNYTMDPPTEYQSAAAKLKAMRAKRCQYYAMCRDMILAKWRERCYTNKDDPPESLETLADCIAMVKYAKDDFMQYVRSPRTFTLGVFAEYTKSIPDTPGGHGDREIFKCAMSSIEDFLERATRGQGDILQLCGVCDEWRTADQVCWGMSDTIAMVDDIYCHALTDGDAELAVVHFLKGFLYQNYNDY
ncbi:uncharacterized protein F5891DRAFT_1191809 [Suillus fuscotomentosus]|uniref:Uncharacterized protein n=1 Tax=Suillus fuscotomentosus TaxID=1912939 RepID=A0AAD4E135_9AGAM|nr:uncharacterized protein F5891DRAFT_1191809 [Suillus fuscotomentosus]KAG1897605.1 hypothetical protein F5891DRAFT_1191809 [Suillus fuscotomentosus]